MDVVTDVIATLPPDMFVREPAAATQTASSFAAVVVDALKVPVGGFGSQG
jgi:hypothetical protein